MNNDPSGGIVGIETIFGTTEGIIYGNHITNNKHENCYPYWGWNGNYPYKYPLGNQPPNIEVPNQGDGAGVELTGVYTTIPLSLPEKYIIISNNHAVENLVGIRAEQGSKKVNISNNILLKNIMYGIFIYSGDKIICNSNIISSSNNASGISIQDAQGQGVVSNIQLCCNNIENGSQGIELRACNGCVITNNIFQNQTQKAIALYDSTYTNDFCQNIIINSNIYNNILTVFSSETNSTNSTIINDPNTNISYNT